MANWLRGWKTAGGDPVKNRDPERNASGGAALGRLGVNGAARGRSDNERVDQLARAQAEDWRGSVARCVAERDRADTETTGLEWKKATEWSRSVADSCWSAGRPGAPSTNLGSRVRAGRAGSHRPLPSSSSPIIAARRGRSMSSWPSSTARISSSTTRPSAASWMPELARLSGMGTCCALHGGGFCCWRGGVSGQRNSLDACASALGVDNSQRQLHGALLDAQILAEVCPGADLGAGEMELRDGASGTGTVEQAAIVQRPVGDTASRVRVPQPMRGTGRPCGAAGGAAEEGRAVPVAGAGGGQRLTAPAVAAQCRRTSTTVTLSDPPPSSAAATSRPRIPARCTRRAMRTRDRRSSTSSVSPSLHSSSCMPGATRRTGSRRSAAPDRSRPGPG